MRHLSRSLTLFALATGTLTLSPGTLAATATNTFQVTATVSSGCTVSATTLNFGSTIDPTTAAVPLDNTATLTVRCSNSTNYSVSLNAGVNAGGAANFGSRTMLNGALPLVYQLYTDSGRTTVWGDGTASSSTVPGTGSGNAQTLPIYGRIASLATASPGTYTDTVQITVTY